MSVYIHNFYTDLLLSIRYLFDDVIFKGHNFIQTYQFNYGNRSFQLPIDFSTQFRLPAAVVQLQDTTLTLDRKKPHITKQLPVTDINQNLILYNETKDTEIILQEEEVDISVNVNVNCESQLQANDAYFVITRWLPPNRYLELYEFVSFLEIPAEFLLASGFDIQNDHTINLFTKFDSNLGKVNYCFAVRYRPLIKLSSCTLNIGDSTQRTFSVQCSFIFTIQRPVYLICHKYKIIDNIAVNLGHFHTETIAPIDTFTLAVSNQRKYKILIDYLLHTLPIYIYSDEFTEPIFYNYIHNLPASINEIINNPDDYNKYINKKELPNDPYKENLPYLSITYSHNDKSIKTVRLILSFLQDTLDLSEYNEDSLDLILIRKNNVKFYYLSDTEIVKDTTITTQQDRRINKLIIDLKNFTNFIDNFSPNPTNPLIFQLIKKN